MQFKDIYSFFFFASYINVVHTSTDKEIVPEKSQNSSTHSKERAERIGSEIIVKEEFIEAEQR